MSDQYIGHTKIHPAALMFPEMSANDVVALSEDIRKNGLRHPVVLHREMLLDGRNRARASKVAGIPFESLPKVVLPDDADPYAFAWSANCERLDYPPAKKAELKLQIEKESQRLLALKKEAEESRREKTRIAAVKQHNPGKVGVRHVADTQPMPPKEEPKPDRRQNSVAAKLAVEAGVGQRTMERVMAKLKAGKGGTTHRRKIEHRGETWRVPREVGILAAFLREHMPSDEIKRLGELLLGIAEGAP